MKDCIFCKIISGEIPTHHKLYEDDETLSFLDVSPNNPGHALVISKDHFENIYSTPPEAFARMAITAQKIALAVKKGVEADGINLIMNNEPAGGQVVFHSHIHIIPRKENDGFMFWPQGKYQDGEAEIVAEKIKESLQD